MSWLVPISRLSTLTREHGLREALTRACRRSLTEVRLHARAAWWSLAGGRLPSERTILENTAQRWASLQGLIDQMFNKPSPAFLCLPQERERWVAHWRANYPGQVRLSLKQAEDICAGRFDILGAHYDFGSHHQGSVEIDWHLDAASGRRWPREYIERIDRWFWSGQRIGDYKPVWELNRHQYLTTLGKAYYLTGDEKYAETCAAHICSWVSDNPCPFGINWYSALEIGIRLIAWGMAFQYVRNSPRFAKIAGRVFVRSLYQQVSFLREHLTLSWAGRNNHIIGEATALAYVGALFDEFSAAGEWRELGQRIVEEEVQRQTYGDGVNREQASGYQRFVLDFVLLLIVLARRGALRSSVVLETYAEKMLEYLMFVTTPGGDVPLLGDADDGRGFVLSASPVRESFREALAIGAVLFQRPDFKFVAGDFGEGAFWLLGEEGRSAFEAIGARQPERTCISFAQGGHYIMRSGWDGQSDYALLRCGEFGLAGEGFCAHAHCDLLSPVLWIKGTPLLVDSGTYTYDGEGRDQFRMTVAHNTVMIDGADQAVPAGPFSWQQITAARCEKWEDGCVVGSLRTPGGVTFRRELTYPQVGVWRLKDTFIGTGYHCLLWSFHLAPGLVATLLPSNQEIHIAHAERADWAVTLHTPKLAISVEDSWVSYEYGRRLPNRVVRAWWRGDLRVEGVPFTWQFNWAGSD